MTKSAGRAGEKDRAPREKETSGHKRARSVSSALDFPKQFCVSLTRRDNTSGRGSFFFTFPRISRIMNIIGTEGGRKGKETSRCYLRRRLAAIMRTRSHVDRFALTSVFTAKSIASGTTVWVSSESVKCYANCNHIVTDRFMFHVNTSAKRRVFFWHIEISISSVA